MLNLLTSGTVSRKNEPILSWRALNKHARIPDTTVIMVPF